MSIPPAITRRRSLQTTLAAAALLGTRGWARERAAGAPARWLLAGGSRGEGIYRHRWNPITGEIGAAELAVATPQPTWLTRHPRLPIVYACNETDSPDTSAVSAFHFDTETAQLHLLGSQPTQGAAPCFASIDRTGRLLFTANYGGGNLSVFPLTPDGKLRPAATVFQCAGTQVCGTGGPVKDRQSAPHLHCATLSPDNRFVLACDLGDDAILAFPFDAEAAEPLGQVTRFPTGAGDGPRHLGFHPNGHWLYCVNELACSTTVYAWRPTRNKPKLAPQLAATVSILPPNTPPGMPNSGAELRLSSDGRMLYASTRGADLLTAFSVDPASGRLTQVQQIACGGRMPRFFALDPDDRWLVCAHQDSDTLAVFARDVHTGHLALQATCPALNPETLLWL